MARIFWSTNRFGEGRRRAGPSAWTAMAVRWNFACCTSSSSPATAISNARMFGSISQPSSDSCRRAKMMDAETTGRPNQKRRTRKELLQAASRLMKQGRKPSLEEIDEEALVSRATAYRYFPGVEAWLVEASLDEIGRAHV